MLANLCCFTSYGSYKGFKQQKWPSRSFSGSGIAQGHWKLVPSYGVVCVILHLAIFGTVPACDRQAADRHTTTAYTVLAQPRVVGLNSHSTAIVTSHRCTTCLIVIRQPFRTLWGCYSTLNADAKYGVSYYSNSCFLIISSVTINSHHVVVSLMRSEYVSTFFSTIQRRKSWAYRGAGYCYKLILSIKFSWFSMV